MRTTLLALLLLTLATLTGCQSLRTTRPGTDNATQTTEAERDRR